MDENISCELNTNTEIQFQEHVLLIKKVGYLESGETRMLWKDDDKPKIDMSL